MDNRQITVVLAEPSAIISAGFASVLANYNTFRIVERVSDLRFLPDVVARYSPEIIVVNPVLFDYKSKFSVRSIVSGTDGPALAALTSTLYDEMVFSQFDAVISIYDSPAAIIKSLRKAVDASKGGTSRLKNEDYDLSEREKEILVAVAKGKTNKEIVDYMVERYGDFVLYKPPFKLSTAILWLGPLCLFVAGLGAFYINLRRRKRMVAEAAKPLSAQDKALADELLSGRKE